MHKNIYIGAIAVVVLLLIGWYAVSRIPSANPAFTPTTVTYACEPGSIVATYRDAEVAITLSDGRSFTLPQAVSASGIRYEQGAGTEQEYLFASKGDNAFFMENGKSTYDNCVANSTPTESQNGMKTFTDSGKSFQFHYPEDLAVTGGGVGYSTDWSFGTASLGMLLAKVSVPKTFEPKTNFSEARFTVGTSADPQAVHDCLAAPQGSSAAPVTVTINGTSYTKFVSGDAGAGNFYETTSYHALRDSQCYAIEYTIHSTNLGNYSPDQGISAFDKAKVQAVLESMVQSFRFL